MRGVQVDDRLIALALLVHREVQETLFGRRVPGDQLAVPVELRQPSRVEPTEVVRTQHAFDRSRLRGTQGKPSIRDGPRRHDESRRREGGIPLLIRSARPHFADRRRAAASSGCDPVGRHVFDDPRLDRIDKLGVGCRLADIDARLRRRSRSRPERRRSRESTSGHVIVPRNAVLGVP